MFPVTKFDLIIILGLLAFLHLSSSRQEGERDREAGNVNRREVLEQIVNFQIINWGIRKNQLVLLSLEPNFYSDL